MTVPPDDPRLPAAVEMIGRTGAAGFQLRYCEEETPTVWIAVMTKSENCLICGAVQPPGHVIVTDEHGRREGRVCSSHTLKEIILDRSDRFLVDIIINDNGVRALERAQARKKR